MNSIGLQQIREAAVRLTGVAHRTPAVTSGQLDAIAGYPLVFKCENLQRVGAFKFRGAWNAVSQLTDAEAARGVVTHSSGNHAQALALAARERGIPAHIVMPNNAPPVKRVAVEGYGARIIECEPTLAARETTAATVLAETGGVFIHPYDNPHIIAGQGTAALELLDDVPNIDVIIAPIGGGGLMSGTCLAAHGIKPSLRVIGAEPAGADDAARSLAAGKLIPQTGPDTVADGLLTSLGELTWPIIRDHVESIVTVDDPTILRSMRVFWERTKLIIEPSSATAVAVAMSEEVAALNPRRVGVILSGGNVNLDALGQYFSPRQ